MLRIRVNKRTKRVFFVIAVIVFMALGYFIEKHKGDSFLVEPITEEESLAYQSEEKHIIDGKLNINAADAEEFKVIDGIGDVIAERIVKYREENGPFTSVDDIKSVKGISTKMLDAMRDKICVDERTFEE